MKSEQVKNYSRRIQIGAQDGRKVQVRSLTVKLSLKVFQQQIRLTNACTNKIFTLTKQGGIENAVPKAESFKVDHYF